MKKLLIFLALMVGAFGADAANDVVLSQRKADNSGFIQRNVAPVTNGLLTFDASKVPTSPSGYTLSGTTFGVPDAFSLTSAGSIDLTAGGTNENITLTPSGTTGDVVIPDNASGTGRELLIGLTSGSPVFGSGIMLQRSGTPAVFQIDTYDSGTTGSSLVFRHARGSSASPSAILADDAIMSMSNRGYGATGFASGSRADFNVFASENWTDSAQGTYMRFRTTPNGSTTVAESFRVWADQSIRVPSTNTAGLQLYNTADQVTNYERLDVLWSSNVARLRAISSGSGVNRALTISAPGASVTLSATVGNINGGTEFVSGSTPVASSVGWAFSNFTSTATSGTTVGVRITPTYNQASGTAANTDLQITRTETALGSGAQNLIAAGTTALGNQFVVNNRGGVSVSYQSLSGSGAVNVTNYSTELTSTGVAQALTLADGVAGQIKVIVHGVDGGSMVLTPTTKTGFTTITFTNAGDAVTLQFFTTRGWIIIGIFGAVAA